MMNHNIKQILIIIFLGLYSTGCDKKDPVSSSDPIPDGLSISYPDSYVDGILTVVVEGEEDDHEDHEEEDGHAMIGGFQLVTEDHAEVHCEDLLEEASCDASEDCEWHADEGACEDHDADGDHDDHGMMIEITGVSVGTTSFQIQLMHDGHSDYTSLPIPVTVVNPVTS